MAIATSTASVYAMSALTLTMIITFVYFAIFWMIWFIIGWGVLRVFRPIISLLKGDMKRYD